MTVKRAAVCKNIFRNVVKDDETYVYKCVNISALLTYSGKRCSKIPVWVPKVKKYADQYACVCFISPSVIALDIPREYLQYYREKIMMYPKTTLQIMVFKYNKDRRLQSFRILQ